MNAKVILSSLVFLAQFIATITIAQEEEVTTLPTETIIFEDTAKEPEIIINQHKADCDKAVNTYELQFHLMVQAKVDKETANNDLNNANPLYFFSRGANARAVKANQELFDEASKNVETALATIYSTCGPSAVDYIKEVELSVLNFFNKIESN